MICLDIKDFIIKYINYLLVIKILEINFDYMCEILAVTVLMKYIYIFVI